MNFDAKDFEIAQILSQDAGLSDAEIGEKLGLSQSAVWRRVKAMKDAGVIEGYELKLDAAALGWEVVVYLGVKLALKGRHALEDFETAVAAIPEVVLVQHVLGVYDYRLRVVARDLADFERIFRRRIMTIPGIGQIESNVRLAEEKSV